MLCLMGKYLPLFLTGCSFIQWSELKQCGVNKITKLQSSNRRIQSHRESNVVTVTPLGPKHFQGTCAVKANVAGFIHNK